MKKAININKTLITVLVVNVLQIVLLAGVIIYGTAFNPEIFMKGVASGEILFLSVIVLTSIINGIFILRDSIASSSAASQYEMLKDTLEQVENLNKTLRVQRHDFMNHLQVVFSLIEMDEYKDARTYIEQVYTDIQKVSRILKTSNPAINALLQAKASTCEKKSINMDIQVASRLENLKVESWEMCRVLGNLIDNAIDALEEIQGKKELTVIIKEDLKGYYFIVEDNGLPIPQDIFALIFQPGFTTKNGKNQGMGLAITKETIESHNGTVSVNSESSRTAFEVYIPRVK